MLRWYNYDLTTKQDHPPWLHNYSRIWPFIIKFISSLYTLLQVSLDAMFDVQIKRIHEYKRQLLNILGIIHRYDSIKVSLLLSDQSEALLCIYCNQDASTMPKKHLKCIFHFICSVIMLLQLMWSQPVMFENFFMYFLLWMMKEIKT